MIELNNLIDFEYGGRRLSDYNSMICDFSNSGVETIDTANELSPTTVKTAKKRWVRTSSLGGNNYSSPLVLSLSITKDMCSGDESPFYNQMEIDAIYRWLNSPINQKFSPIYSKTDFHRPVHCYGYFNVQAVTVGSNVIGLSLTLNTDAPFCFYPEVKIEPTIKDNAFVINDNSSEMYYTYPTYVITVSGGGDVFLKNETTGDIAYFTNCTDGQVITLDTLHERFDLDTGDVSDFNYMFPPLYNDMRINNETGKSNIQNKFSTQNIGSVVITYEPICKFGII